jgi:hypothetical protein
VKEKERRTKRRKEKKEKERREGVKVNKSRVYLGI